MGIVVPSYPNKGCHKSIVANRSNASGITRIRSNTTLPTVAQRKRERFLGQLWERHKQTDTVRETFVARTVFPTDQRALATLAKPTKPTTLATLATSTTARYARGAPKSKMGGLSCTPRNERTITVLTF